MILEEGLDTEEVKRRILRYKSGRRLAAKKKLNGLKSTVSSYLSNYSQKSKTYDRLRLRFLLTMLTKPFRSYHLFDA